MKAQASLRCAYIRENAKFRNGSVIAHVDIYSLCEQGMVRRAFTSVQSLLHSVEVNKGSVAFASVCF